MTLRNGQSFFKHFAFSFCFMFTKTTLTSITLGQRAFSPPWLWTLGLIRVQDACCSDSLADYSPFGGGQGVRHWIHPWPHRQHGSPRQTHPPPPHPKTGVRSPQRGRYEAWIETFICRWGRRFDFFEKEIDNSRSWASCLLDKNLLKGDAQSQRDHVVLSVVFGCMGNVVSEGFVLHIWELNEDIFHLQKADFTDKKNKNKSSTLKQSKCFWFVGKMGQHWAIFVNPIHLSGCCFQQEALLRPQQWV